jgi:hypothetical protein
MLENEPNLLQVGSIVLHMQKEEGMVESQLEHIQRIIAKEATKVLQDRANIQLQQQTLVCKTKNHI